jgi:hypothetical protein
VINDEAIIWGSSQGVTAIIEAVQCPGDVPPLSISGQNQSLWFRSPRLRRPYSVLGRRKLGATPACAAASDDGEFVALSYWDQFQGGSVDGYEIRSWPDLEPIADFPEKSVFWPGGEDRILANDEPLVISPCGEFLVTRWNSLAGSRGIHIIEIEKACHVSQARFGEVAMLLGGSTMNNARVGPCLFSNGSAKLGALFIPNKILLEHNWFPLGPPDLHSFDAAMRPGILWVKGWCTRTGEPTDVEFLRRPLFDVFREAMRCPNIECSPRPPLQ